MPTNSFEYLEAENYYFDTACQSLRPKGVIEAELTYYTDSNTCGGRGNYGWAKTVDAKMSETRTQILQFLGKSAVQYAVVFCPNTTYGINLILSNLNSRFYRGILTSDKEHNSAFLPAMSWAKGHQKPMHILGRNVDASLDLGEISQYPEHILLCHTTSNLDGMSIPNLSEMVYMAKKHNQLVLLDATQSLAHHRLEFLDTDFDCLFASGHKLYAPSMGFMVIKRELIKNLEQTWVGGGTVQLVEKDDYQLISLNEELHARLEFGLQDYAAIFGLSEALSWLKNYRISQEYPSVEYHPSPMNLSQRFLATGSSQEAIYYIDSLSELLFTNLQNLQNQGLIRMLNDEPSPIVSLVARGVNSYELSSKLAEQNIMCRSGYMCCHHFIREVLGAGPMLRISLGLHNTPRDIAKLLITLEQLL